MTDYRKMYIRMLDEAERVLDVLESGRDNEQKVFLACAMLAAALQDCEDLYVETSEI